MGDSMVQGMGSLVSWGGDFDACSYTYRGQTARQINGHIRDIDIAQYDAAVLYAGTNNTHDQPVAQCIEEMRQLTDNVARKRQGKPVLMCLLSRNLREPVNDKIDQINDFIKSEVEKRENWHVVSCDLDEFTDYKRDGLHLNKSGSAKLALEIRRIIRRLNVV